MLRKWDMGRERNEGSRGYAKSLPAHYAVHLTAQSTGQGRFHAGTVQEGTAEVGKIYVQQEADTDHGGRGAIEIPLM